MNKKWIVFFVLIIVVVFGYNYVYQDHRNIEQEAAMYMLEADSFMSEFDVNPEVSEKKYLNNTVQIMGNISKIDSSVIILNNSIFCQFSTSIKQLYMKDSITVKGRFIGYDDLLGDIKLDQCLIINQNQTK
ncbi:MAG: hypothetical protein GYB32_09515 [Algicola sp.]|nr:hypothetical protein [Algicola sp.]